MQFNVWSDAELAVIARNWPLSVVTVGVSVVGLNSSFSSSCRTDIVSYIPRAHSARRPVVSRLNSVLLCSVHWSVPLPFSRHSSITSDSLVQIRRRSRGDMTMMMVTTTTTAAPLRRRLRSEGDTWQHIDSGLTHTVQHLSMPERKNLQCPAWSNTRSLTDVVRCNY